VREVQVVPDGVRLGRLTALAARGTLTVSVAEPFPLHEAAAALLQTRHGWRGMAAVVAPGRPG
jgi:hypothetical protein